MEKKKVKKILIPIISVVLIITIAAAFLVYKSNNNSSNKNQNNNASNVLNTTERKDLDIFNSWTNKEYSVDYNGNYTFSSVYSVNFNPLLTREQIEKLYFDIAGTYDNNGFMSYLYNEKKKTTRRETISIVNGQFSRSVKYIGIKESGYFYGNNNRSYLYIKNSNNELITKSNGDKYLYEISLTAYNLSSKNTVSTSENKLFITEHIFSSKNPNTELYSVTYEYDLVKDPENQIPNSNIVVKGE